jgi:hypothetical protein
VVFTDDFWDSALRRVHKISSGINHGRLRTQSIREIWDGKQLVGLRDSLVKRMAKDQSMQYL